MQIVRNEATGHPVRIIMRKPACMHQHLRTGEMLKHVAPMVAKRFFAAIIMPNLVPPLTSAEAARVYRNEILAVTGSAFLPMMTLYLTDTLNADEVELMLKENLGFGVKYYPPGLTTNSESGVANPASLWTRGTKPYEVLKRLADYHGVLLLHAADGYKRKANDELDKSQELDPYDQEEYFLIHTLPKIIAAHPRLKVSVEHLSTERGAKFMAEHGGSRLGCSLTPHHLLLNRTDVFRGGFRPDRSWMPVIQPRKHQDALRALAKKGLPFVWLGSDSAPHPAKKKYAECCASGVLTAHAGIELYAEAFENMLDKLEDFACINGPKFYNLMPSDEQITLVREDWTPKEFFIADSPATEATEKVVPFRLGETIRWKLAA